LACLTSALRSSATGFFLAAVIACPPEDAVLVFARPHSWETNDDRKTGFLVGATGGPYRLLAGGASQMPDRAALLVTLMKLELESWQVPQEKERRRRQGLSADDATLILARARATVGPTI